MRKARLAVAVCSALASIALATPAVAAPTHAPAQQQSIRSDDGWRHHRFGHRFGRFGFGFPVVTPFFGGGFGSPFFGGGFGGFGFGGGCEVFLEIGDIQSYILCRVG